MDPADPYFQGTDVKVRLDPGDADFVDIIHTDGSSILALGLGTNQAMGHVDFFPNGGKDQPGCDAGLLAKVGHTVWNAVSKLDYYAAEGAVACSHERSYELFTESINSACPFRAYPCTSADEFHNGKCLRCHQDDCSEMGLNANKYSARGSLYLETEATSNYCDFHYQLNVSGSNNFDGRLIITLHGSKTNAGPIQLMKDTEVHNQGTIISKMFKTNVDVGEVIGITLDYEKTTNLVVGWAFPDNWTLNGIAVWSATDQKLYRFCAYNKVAANHVKTTFGVSDHCT
ncbi:hypothetical protein ACJMK2_042000 [Sinanodonta woodiana]|uniref:PLAT domain-containing protein n=1 Tax=Sinanodonta woodiana TaxID=1069815 RepID=A0ABD3W7D1_SINWO